MVQITGGRRTGRRSKAGSHVCSGTRLSSTHTTPWTTPMGKGAWASITTAGKMKPHTALKKSRLFHSFPALLTTRESVSDSFWPTQKAFLVPIFLNLSLVSFSTILFHLGCFDPGFQSSAFLSGHLYVSLGFSQLALPPMGTQTAKLLKLPWM